MQKRLYKSKLFYQIKLKMKSIMNLKSIELCAGCGGMALGLKKSGINAELLVDFDKYACETLKKNFPNSKIICDDIANVNFTEFEGWIDIISAGFPCQPFSFAGKGKGMEDERGLVIKDIFNVIKIVKPPIVLLENVQGLLKLNDGKYIKYIKESLKSMGYNFINVHLFNSVEFNVPQKRKRLIILASKDIDIKLYSPKYPLVNLRKALEGVPVSAGSKYSDYKRGVLDLVPAGGCWVNLPINIQKEYLGKSFYSGGGKRGMARRLSWDEACLTLTCSPAQKQTERCHPDETRPFTYREYARIQTFPDSFEFCGSLNQRYKQIGNAFPVVMAKNIGEQICTRILQR